MQHLSKSQFKPKALEIMRSVEQGGEPIIITDHGKPVLELKAYVSNDIDPIELLKGSVVEFIDPFEPIAEDEWESAS
ncbi:MAG: type II toxin-antitoxin system Phd/YefM family antitoxin [Porticoccaceae bacterium]|nr:type II toxin-antitoxin system Phd/YefM family antitoxin [Porticoccaceae bacterium]